MARLARVEEDKKGSASVLNNVNGRFEKKSSNSSFVQCVDRDVGFFEAWVSVFDEVLNRNYRLSILALAGEPECGSNGGDLRNSSGEPGT